MAFTRFSFTKSWTDPSDFPTVESDETKVRADMQSLHDEGKEGLNGLMEQLEQAAAAASLGARALDGSGDSTVQQELGAIHQNMEERFGSVKGVATELGSDHTTLPTSKAVSDAISSATNLPSGGAAGQVLMKNSAENFDMVWSAITSESIGALRVASGSYTGSGNHGSSSPNILTFEFEPCLVLVKPEGLGRHVVFVKNTNARYANPKPNLLSECHIRVNWEENGISWYASTYQYYLNYGDSTLQEGSADDGMQLNAQDQIYHWVAFGL